MENYSPLRYPGGKAHMFGFLNNVLRINGPIDTYVEPYAGAGGAALALLFHRTVKKVILNDLDGYIYFFWQAILSDTKHFIRKLERTPVSISEWKKQKGVLSKGKASLLNLGFATFYINRCNRSGILSAGPIGGLDQTGHWKVDARFNKGLLKERIERISAYRNQIKVYNWDALYFLKNIFPNINFKDFSDLFLKNYSMVKKRAWMKSDKVYLRANLNPFFGDYRLAKVDTELIENYVAKRLSNKVAKSTVNRDLSCLKKLFNKALDWGYLSENPASKIKQFPERDNFRSRVLSPEEEEKLLGQLPWHVREMVLIALGTGMRLGEILHLSWAQIDIGSRRIRVEKTKSGKIRYIPINATLHHTISELKERNGVSPLILVNSSTQKPYTTVKTAFNAACRRSGISDLHFHDLRRTFATRLLQRGADIETVRDLLGHYSVLVTQRYTCSNEETKRKAVELLSQAPGEVAENAGNLLHRCDMATNSHSLDSVKVEIPVN